MCAGAERGSAASTRFTSRMVCSGFPCCRCSAAAPSCSPCDWVGGACARATTGASRSTTIASRGTVRLYLNFSALRIGLVQQQNLAGGDALDGLLLPAGPFDLDAGRGCLTQPEIQPQVAGAEVTSVRIHF